MSEAPAFDGRAAAAALTGKPGVYRMLDARGAVLYVGKARSLRKRVASYFQRTDRHGPRIRAMLAQVAGLEVTVTRTENEALILESNLIKELRPRYNIVLRDDKSYPYIYLSSHQDFPRLAFHRGARKGKGRWFGPYPSAGAVRATLNLLQKLFLIRQCEDSFFRNRSRPCLQYQIQRCTAPCVGYIDAAAYQEDVAHAVLFLEGRSREVVEALVRRMEEASGRLEFERAARYRDQIHQLQKVQQRQYISGEGGDADIVACARREDAACVQLFFIRGGHNLGNKAFFPQHTAEASAAEILAAFVAQYYLAGGAERAVPAEILLSEELADSGLLARALSARAGRRVVLSRPQRGERARWVDMALANAELALGQRLTGEGDLQRRLEALGEALALEEPPGRIECFDVSHTGGEATVASCVVFDAEGPKKSDYRRFNIEGVEPGDDYAAMHQAISRRYTRLKREEARMPDLLLIDGGKGQVAEARRALEALQVNGVPVVGVAKGPSRRPGLETLILSDGRRSLSLDPASPALHLIQQIRDEAHRFAITGHRQRRAKARSQSPLEGIPGVGAKRRQSLMQRFGGLQGIARAGVEDLARVPGVSQALAQRIYDLFHEGP